MTNHYYYCYYYYGLALVISTWLSVSHGAESSPLSFHTISVTADGRVVSANPSKVVAAQHENPVSQQAYRLHLSRRSDLGQPSIHDLIARSQARDNFFLHASLNSHNNNNNYNTKISTPTLTHGDLKQDSTSISTNGYLKDEVGMSQVSLNSSVTPMEFEYLTSLEIGSPPQEITLIIDTGSALIWTQCIPHCKECFTQPQPIYNHSKSSTFKELPCKHNSFCTYLNTNGDGSSCSTHRTCSYSYEYGDSSYTNGLLSTETLILSDGNGQSSTFPSIVFGCGQENGPDGSFDNSSGVLGLGQGLVSLTTQLGEVIDHQFSYCLVPWDSPTEKKGTLLMGKGAITHSSKTIKTQILTNNASNGEHKTFYYVPLEGVSVGGKPVDIPKGTFDIKGDGSGGMIVDSGTSVTLLEQEGYDVILEAFKASMVGIKQNTTQDFFDLCFVIPGNSGSNLEVPTFTMNFHNNVSLELPPENYFTIIDNNICLVLAGSSDISIFGNIQQQNIEFGFDVKGKVLSMTPTTC